MAKQSAPVQPQMTPDESLELFNAVSAVAVQDVHLGRALHLMIVHLPGYALPEPAPVEVAPAEEVPAEAPAEEPSA